MSGITGMSWRVTYQPGEPPYMECREAGSRVWVPAGTTTSSTGRFAELQLRVAEVSGRPVGGGELTHHLYSHWATLIITLAMSSPVGVVVGLGKRAGRNAGALERLLARPPTTPNCPCPVPVSGRFSRPLVRNIKQGELRRPTWFVCGLLGIVTGRTRARTSA